MVPLGGFPARSHFCNLGLGTEGYIPGDLYPALLFSSIIVLKGVV